MNCATGADGASVVVVVVVVLVVVEVGGIVVGEATIDVVDEVGERDSKLVPAPLHAVRNNAIRQTDGMTRVGREDTVLSIRTNYQLPRVTLNLSRYVYP